MRLRGRKGIREELEQQPELVVLEPQQWKGRWRERFGNDKPIHVELGMGKGIFISEMSRRNPDINFIGIDMYDELVRRAAIKARDAHSGQPANLALVLANIGLITDVFATDEIERVYLNFSDPWPKKRHASRRLTHPNFLRKYITFLNPQGQIHLKTDSRLLFEFSLNAFADMNLRMRQISLDLHAEGERDDLVMTEYEKKFVGRGMPIHRCEVLIGNEAIHSHVAALELADKAALDAEAAAEALDDTEDEERTDD
jgi:tRNA (guanine-N7-)-methyltransferase